MKIRTLVATTVATATLAFGVGGTALATGAAADTTPSTLPAAFCQKAHERYEKLVAANQKAKENYQKARDLQAKLESEGHTVAAHRLDVRLDHLRNVHTRIVARVEAIRAKVKDRCGDPGPDPETIDS
ncbi:MAG TPA: hypothetical protein VFC99_05485 [Acidimicrobiia bacterium]|nr:hypothetical protein [Acidimicrobiia bacterium]